MIKDLSSYTSALILTMFGSAEECEHIFAVVYFFEDEEATGLIVSNEIDITREREREREREEKSVRRRLREIC